MTVPNWYQLAVLVAAAWRTYQLLAWDKILDRPRRWLVGKAWDWNKAADFIECPYCFGAWVAILWWVAWEINGHWTLIVAIPFALSAGVIALSKILHSEP